MVGQGVPCRYLRIIITRSPVLLWCRIAFENLEWGRFILTIIPLRGTALPIGAYI